MIMTCLLAWVMQHDTKETRRPKGQTRRKAGTQSHGSKSRSGHDSRAAEVILNDAFGHFSQWHFYPSITFLKEGNEPFEWRTAVESGSESDKKGNIRRN